ncbi:MAG: hypothetical protein ABJC10_02330 [Acidobacteriota bacterium]
MSTTDEPCPDCGGELRFEDQTSFSGNKIRDYKCLKCGRNVIEDCGVALWKVIHDTNQANEENEKKKE